MNDNTLCRLCYTNPGVTSIFEHNSGIKLSSKIMYCCTRIRVSEDDHFPVNICECCEKDLELSYCFILKCEETDKRLRSIDCKVLKSESDSKSEIKEEIDVCLFQANEDDRYDSFSDVKQEEEEVKFEPRTKRKYTKRTFKTKHKIKNSKCKVCGRVCQNPSTLVIHMRSHTNEKPYLCPSCDKKYKDSGSLKRHVERNHLKDQRERKFICEICGKGFFSKSDIKIHMRTHTGDTPYACTVCPARFTQINSLHRHRVRHTGERAHKCSTCHKTFCSKEELKKHYVVHTNIKNYKCTTCNALFKYRNSLKKHMSMHFVANNFICNYCGRHFSVKGNLQIHIKRVHSDKSGYCNICLKDVSNIETHSWKHTGERPLKCELCSRSFYERNALGRHINLKHKHTDKYKCTINGCKYSFPMQSMLDFHILKFHGTSVPFPCDACSRGFYRKSDLVRHRKGTHKEPITA